MKKSLSVVVSKPWRCIIVWLSLWYITYLSLLKRLFQTGAWPFSSDVGKKLTKEYKKTEKNGQILLSPSDQEY